MSNSKITLFRSATGIMAQYEGERRAEVMELFEADTLPTGFTGSAEKESVLATIRKLNPDCEVVWHDPT